MDTMRLILSTKAKGQRAKCQREPAPAVVKMPLNLASIRLVALHRDYDALHREDFVHLQGAGCAVVPSTTSSPQRGGRTKDRGLRWDHSAP
jgi:hypothetical protein